MKNKLRFLIKNKQGLIALFVLLAMAFNACSSPVSSNYSPVNINPPEEKPGEPNTGEFTPMSFFVDERGNFTETDSGRTVLVADDQAEVVFYSDNIDSGDDDRVGLTFDDKSIIFIFEKGQSFPGSIVLSSPDETYNGIFTSYDPDTETYCLTLEKGDEKETLSDVFLGKDIFSQYIYDDDLTPSQNLRMRNLYIAMRIYTSLDDFFNSDDTPRTSRGILGWFIKTVAQVFFPPPVASIVVGTVLIYEAVDELLNPGPITIIKGILDPNSLAGSMAKDINNGINLITNGVNQILSVSVTGVSLNKTSFSLTVGDSATLSPAITPSNATNKSVSWSSSNTAVAYVSTGGTVTAVQAGSATITVTTANGGKKASCTVSVTAPAAGTTDGSGVYPFPLTLNTWLDGNITYSTNTVWYSFSVTSGTTYRVWWNDSYQGNNTKSLDVKVSAAYSNGVSIFTDKDSGWNTAQSFTANQTGTVKIKVVPYNSGYTGTFAVAYSTGVERPNISSGNNTTVDFNSVTANGSASQTSTQLKLAFSQAITGLSADDISLSGVSGVTKGTLSGSGPSYTLPITVTAGGTLSVAVKKSGYTINGSPRTVTIYYYTPPTAVTFNSVTANGSASQTTTQLTLAFSQAITGLSADDISLSGVSGVIKGTLSGSGPSYTLPITVTAGGTLNVAVSKSGYTINGSPGTVTIYYYTTPTAVTFNSVTANGTTTQTTTQLTLTFSQAITGFTADDISLSGVSGVTKGTLGGSGPAYTLPVSGFTTGGTLSVAVKKSGYTISGSPKTVTIYCYINNDVSVGIVIDLSGMDEWELTEQTAQAAPNVNKTFTVTGTYTSYRWYLDGMSVGTSSSYIFNKPTGVYQLVVVVTNSNEESRSGRCRVTVGNIAAGGSANGTEANPFPLSINTWRDGTITSGTNTVWYSFPVTSGTTYRVWWNDGYEGNYTRSLDVIVSAVYSNGASIFTNADSGWYTAQSFTANQTGTVKIKVIPYSYYDTGTFAVAYGTSSTRP